MARTLEMERATSAWQHIQDVKARAKVRGRYGARVRDMGALIMTDGLGQSLAYLRAKGKSGQAADHRKPEQEAHHLLFEHLSAWVVSVLEGTPGTPVTGAHLLERLIKGESAYYYRRATVETLAYVIWLKKFADAEFGDDIDQAMATDSGGGES
jgi:CRISPR-associated protein Cmr5